MKSDSLQTPQIDVELRNVVEILQKGGRITRSKRNPAGRPPETHPRERTRALVRAQPQPTLGMYLERHGLNPRDVLPQQYLPNKRLRRLNKQFLPEYCFLFEKNYHGYRLKQVRLLPKKARASEFLIEETSHQAAREPQPLRPAATRSLNAHDDAGFLTVVQTLVLVALSFEDFQALFQQPLTELRRNYQRHKIDELSRLSEDRPSQRSLPPEDRELSHPEPLPEHSSFQHLPDPHSEPQPDQPRREEEPRLEEPPKEQSQQQSSVEIYELITREIGELDRAIFQKLGVGKSGMTLWPAVVLQPLIGQLDALADQASRISESQKEEYRHHRPELRAVEKMLQLAFEEVLEDSVFESFDKCESLEGRDSVEISHKVQKKLEEVARKQTDRIVVQLLGTLQTRAITKGFLRWEELNYEQLEFLLSKSPFRAIIEEVNLHIQALNKFALQQKTTVDNKNAFFRLSSLQSPNGETELCIPIRVQQGRDEKRVLVRVLREGAVGENGAEWLRWVQPQQLTVNLTLPRHNESQKRFYYLLGSYVSVQEGLALIYEDFHYRPASFSKVLRRCYPQNELRRTFVREQRCIYCHYKIDKIPHFRCKFCLRFTHQECSPSGRPSPDADTNPPYPADIYETDNDEQVWHCEECAPCSECQLAVRVGFLRCGSCGSQFHNICGRLKANELGEGEKYTCEGCLKCRICSNKLKNQEYFVEGRMTFCLKCFKDFQKDQYCIVCMREQPGKWVQCDKAECSKWVHVLCDSYFREKENKQTLEKANYSCPACRLKQRRKVTKWVIEELRCYDEYQYFNEPEYEEIVGYKEAIPDCMCLFQMREKAVEGKYDSDPYLLITNDLELLVRNAMTFNMPKDEAHYRAKVLLVLGSKFLERVRDLLQCNEEFLVNEDMQALFAARKKQFRIDVYEHLLEYLLNFRAERGTVEVKRINPMPTLPIELEFFSSKIILNRSFANAEFRFRIKKKPHRIENLFTIPRLNKAAWAPIRAPNCYYHPESTNPIIYNCPTCSQSYCCTRICLNHRICSCGARGCGCDRYACGCPAMREKERRSHESKIQSTLSQSKLERREYTEYYKYCLKCVVENLKTNWCYICRNFCYSAYEKCKDCGKIYHSACEKKYKMEEMSVFYEDKACYEEAYSNSRLPQICCACCNSLKYARPLKELLMGEIKSKATKLNAINHYIPLFNYLYEQNGIRLTINETINLLYQNYSLLAQKQDFLNEMLENFSTVIEQNTNNKIARQQFRDFYVNEMSRKLQSQNQHEKYISFVETKEMKELKQSKKFFKIFSKRFNHLYFPLNFASNYEIKYHLEHLTAKMNHSHIAPHHSHQLPDSPIITTNFRDDAHLNLKNFERIKIEAITSYVSPKSKKNIYYTNRLEKLRNYLKFWDYYYEYKRNRIARNREKFEQIIAYEPDTHTENHRRNLYRREEETRERQFREYEKYLRFHADHENLTDCIYKEESSKSLLSEGLHCDNFNPFNENSSLVRYNRLVDYIDYDNIYSANKSEMLFKYLSNFALKIYEENKIVLKKGSTCILNDSLKSRRILKKFAGNTIEIRLEQRNDNWCLQINENTVVVRSIDDIARKLREISPIIETFEDVAEFLGFAMGDSTFYEPNHFTHLLQTQPLDALNRKERKREVLKAYDKYTWKRQGYFSCIVEQNGIPNKYEYNVTKKELFYLKKRTANEQQEDLEPRVTPFITFEDIKKDLEDMNYIATAREKENFVIKEPNYDVYIAPSKIDRLGLFIRTFVKKNTIVAEYIGEVISEAIADIREEKFHFGCYMFGLVKNNTRQEIIDATFIGNMARYLNHSCDPNCKARIEMVNGHPRIFIYTVKDIKENEELTYDYQFKIDTNERLTCKCKAKNCQGRLT